MADTITPVSSAGALTPRFSQISHPSLLHTGTQPPASPGEAAAEGDAQPERPMELGQFIFLAMGGSIGAGLFFGSGEALKTGGPAAVLLVFAVLGLAVWLTMCALSELVSEIPARGSFYDYSVRFISESWGFAMGWNYVVNFTLVVGFEITVIVKASRYWYGAERSLVTGGLIALVPACQVLLALGQVWGARWYGHVERICSVVKVLTLMIFNITAAVIAIRRGGAALEHYQNGKAFQNGLKGLMSVLVIAGMAYGGTEMLGFNAVACRNPGRAMRLSPWIVAARIVACYCAPLFMVGLILDPAVLDEGELAGLGVSPFVAALRVADIPVLPHMVNGAVVVSILSMANASVFASSRALAAICERGMGPRALAGYSTLAGRLGAKVSWLPMGRIPLMALGVVALWSSLAYVVAAEKGLEIFEWLLSLAGVSNLFTWTSIAVSHIRFRSAMKLQGHDYSDLKWRAPWGVSGSYIAAGLITLTIVAQVVSSIMSPVTGSNIPYTTHLMRGILGFICVAVLYAGHLCYVAWRGDRSWRDMLLIPLDKIVLPELGVLEAVDGTDAEKSQEKHES